MIGKGKPAETNRVSRGRQLESLVPHQTLVDKQPVRVVNYFYSTGIRS